MPVERDGPRRVPNAARDNPVPDDRAREDDALATGRQDDETVPDTGLDAGAGDDAAQPPTPVIDPVTSWVAVLSADPTPDSLLDARRGQGALDLTSGHPSGLAQLFAGRPTRLSSLVREPAAHAAARRQARGVRALSARLAAERGVRAAFLASGLATWRPPRRQVAGVEVIPAPVCAPILLHGCTVRPRGAAHDDFDLTLDPLVVVNPELVRRLGEDYGVAVDGHALAGLALGTQGFDPRPVFARLQELCAGIADLTVESALLLGAFTAGVGPMVADLEASREAIAAHRVLGGAGVGVVSADPASPLVEEPAQAIGDGVCVDPDPAEELLVMDLDPAQHAAVDAASAGHDLALEGPPGTGLTHTLAAVAGSLAAQGRVVLVVTPRRASADAFLARLRAAGLDELALDLYDGHGDRLGTLAALGESLEATVSGAAVAASQTPPAAGEQLHETLRQGRAAVVEAARAVHKVRTPWGVSAYEAMVALAELVSRERPPSTAVRFAVPILTRLLEPARSQVVDLLGEAVALGMFPPAADAGRWLDAVVTSPARAQSALAAARAAAAGLADARREMARVARESGLAEGRTAAVWRPQLELLLGVRGTLDVLLPAVFETSLAELVSATAPGGSPPRVRGLRRRARALVRPGVHVRHLNPLLVSAQAQRQVWSSLCRADAAPAVPTGLATAAAAVTVVDVALGELAGVMAGPHAPNLFALGLDELQSELDALAADEEGLRDAPRRCELLRRLRDTGLGPLLEDLRARGCDDGDVVAEFDLAWWASVLQAVVRTDVLLARHDGPALRRASADVRLADRAHIADGARRARLAVAARAREATDTHPGQVRWLRAEVLRGHRSRWPADLFTKAGHVVAALRPVWVMSPEAVAGLLPVAEAGGWVVDAVIVDDAGAVGVPEVAAAVARGRQTIVAGDRRSHPPRSGMESLLDLVAARGSTHRLVRDHRAADGRMLDPVLAHYPDRWLVTRGTSAVPRLRLTVVQGGTGVPAPDEDLAVSADAEVRQVVDLVIEHAARRPDESLMVVTLGERHAERIDEALRLEVPDSPALAAWLEQARTSAHLRREPLVVRPVARARGQERDAVIVSVGLARTPHGRVLHRFGSLDTAGGPAMLVTALTRARVRTSVVCCFAAKDLDEQRLRTDGSRLLRRVLMAADPAIPLDEQGTADEPGRAAASASAVVPGHSVGGDALVNDLARRLRAAGLPVASGSTGDTDWPLDLVLEDPRMPGRTVLGLDLDGAVYAARSSVREVDRQRRERLERAGWAYRRTWVMDLFRDPDAEVERVRADWEVALGEPMTASLPLLDSSGGRRGP